MGAILGAFHAAGYDAEAIHVLVRRTSWRDVLDLSRIGLIKGEKLHAFLAAHLPATFQELQKPLIITATDLESGEEVFIAEGDLLTALRASSCFPGVFEPVHLGGRTLADGGIVNNLPVSALRAFPGYTLASDATEPRRASYTDPKARGSWWERMVATVRLERRSPMAQMLLRSAEIMQSTLTESQYAIYPADLRVRHEIPHIRLESFRALEEIVHLGEEAATEALKVAGLTSEEEATSKKQ
jgi:NTE family protein